MRFRSDGLPLASLGAGVLVLAALVHAPVSGRARDLPGKPGSESWRAAAHLLGGFRPLAVDFFWLRADSLFRSGRLWELAALFRGIVALDPANGLVREYAAWHLAYNVSLAESDPEQRFDWFIEGVRIAEAGLPGARGAWKLETFAGRMFLDRLDAETIPRFEERVRAHFGAGPLEIATRRFEDAAGRPDSGPLAHVHLLAAFERRRAVSAEAGNAAQASRWEARRTAALVRARERFPDTDWDFVLGLDETE